MEEFFNNTVSRDLLWLICGKHLGGGMSRQVYECKLRPDLVLKFETEAGQFQNVMEWETWQELQDYEPAARWLAPCEFISPCGAVLAMRRTSLATKLDYPARLPSFLTDTKRANYGLLEGRLVCHDYGLHRLMSLGASQRVRKVDWWGDNDH